MVGTGVAEMAGVDNRRVVNSHSCSKYIYNTNINNLLLVTVKSVENVEQERPTTPSVTYDAGIVISALMNVIEGVGEGKDTETLLPLFTVHSKVSL